MLKLVKVTESLYEKIYDMFQEIPKQEEFQDINIAHGLSKEDFRKFCVILEMADKNIMLSYAIPNGTCYVLFDDEEPICWFYLKNEKLTEVALHSGHIAYAIKPSKRHLGYASFGLGLLLKEAKKKGYSRVCACVNDNNIASIKVLNKCGFKKFRINNPIQVLTKNYCKNDSQYYLDL